MRQSGRFPPVAVMLLYQPEADRVLYGGLKQKPVYPPRLSSRRHGGTSLASGTEAQRRFPPFQDA